MSARQTTSMASGGDQRVPYLELVLSASVSSFHVLAFSFWCRARYEFGGSDDLKECRAVV